MKFNDVVRPPREAITAGDVFLYYIRNDKVSVSNLIEFADDLRGRRMDIRGPGFVVITLTSEEVKDFLAIARLKGEVKI